MAEKLIQDTMFDEQASTKPPLYHNRLYNTSFSEDVEEDVSTPLMSGNEVFDPVENIDRPRITDLRSLFSAASPEIVAMSLTENTTYGSPGTYQDMRDQGLSDFEIIEKFADVDKTEYPLDEVLAQDNVDPLSVARQLATEINLDFDQIQKTQGIDPLTFLSFLIKGRRLSDTGAAAEGVGRGLMTGVPASAGAIAGATFAAPAGPIPTMAGAVIGGIAGGVLGYMGEQATFPQEPVLDPSARAVKEGTQTFTEGLTFLAQPWLLNKAGAARALDPTNASRNMLIDRLRTGRDVSIINKTMKDQGRFPTVAEIQELRRKYPQDSVMGSFLTAAEKNPKLFYGLEAASAAGAGVGAGVAESVAPAEMLPRVGGEIVGSLSSPLGVAMAVPFVVNKLKTNLERFSTESTEGRVGENLIRVLESLGEDPRNVLARLSSQNSEFKQLVDEARSAYELAQKSAAKERAGVQPEIGPVYQPTSAEVADSFGLRVLQSSLSKIDNDSPNVLRQQNQNNLDVLADLFEALIYTGDQEAIAEAAKLRQFVFEDMIAARLANSGQRAEQASGKFKTDVEQVGDSNTKSQLGVKISNLVNRAYEDVRDQETALYNDVDGTFIVPITNFEQTVLRELENVPDIIQDDDNFPKAGKLLIERMLRVSGRENLESVRDILRQNFYLNRNEVTGTEARAGKLVNSNTLDLVDISLLPTWVVNELGPLKKRATKLSELLKEREQLKPYTQSGINGYAPPPGVTLKDSPQEYSDHFKRLAEEQPETFESTYQAMQQYENVQSRLKSIEKDLVENAVTVSDILPILDGIPEPDPYTLNDIRTIRSAFLDASRDAMAGEKPNSKLARVYSQFSQAIQEDLADEDAISRANFSLLDDGTVSEVDVLRELGKLKKASSFSRAKNDVYRRMFSNEILRDTATGRDFIEPELLPNKLLGGGADAVNLRLQQLKSAVGFLLENQGSLDETQTQRIMDNLTSLKDAETTLLKIAASESFDADNNLNPTKLGNFVKNNLVVLKNFPDLLKDLTDARFATVRFKELEKNKNTIGKVIENYVIKTQGSGTSEVLAEAMSQGPKAFRSIIRQLQSAIPKYEARVGGDSAFMPGGVRVVRRGDFGVGDVNDAIRSAVFEQARIFAGSTSDKGIDFKSYRNYLFGPGKGQTPPVMRTLIQEGVFSEAEAARLSKLLDRSAQIQRDLSADSMDIKALGGSEGLLLDLVARITGAQAGRTAGKALPGAAGEAALIQSSAGSTFTRNLLRGIPAGNLQDILTEAAKNPKYMSLLLEKGLDRKTKREQASFQSAFYAALRSMGITTAAEIVAEPNSDTPQVVPGFQPQAPRPAPQPQMQQQPMPPPQAQMPAPPPPSMQPPMPAQPMLAQPMPQSQQRQRYAQMYPFDSVSEVIRTQGIGGLV